jgi:hypothetical protein
MATELESFSALDMGLFIDIWPAVVPVAYPHVKADVCFVILASCGTQPR